MVFRQGLTDALDRLAPDAVAQVQATGTLDDAHRQVLLDAMRQYANAIRGRNAS